MSTPPPGPGPAPVPRPPLSHPPMGIASLAFGIAGVLFVLPLVGPILALVLGYLARGEVTRQPDVYRDDVGRIGRILGWVGLVLSALAIAALIAFVAWALTWDTSAPAMSL